jgi:hypothetical protein
MNDLSKREYFAALAMQGMMSLPPPDMISWSGVSDKEHQTVAAWVAWNSVAMADAMIAALARPATSPETFDAGEYPAKGCGCQNCEQAREKAQQASDLKSSPYDPLIGSKPDPDTE